MQTIDGLKNRNEQDQTAGDHLRTKKEIEVCVSFVRLEL
jgi:hypothetical protein